MDKSQVQKPGQKPPMSAATATAGKYVANGTTSGTQNPIAARINTAVPKHNETIDHCVTVSSAGDAPRDRSASFRNEAVALMASTVVLKTVGAAENLPWSSSYA